MGEDDTKRKNYISWGDYFMGIAYLCARRSKDPRTQVGACIVDDDNKIVSTGYNGMPHGCEDDQMPWGKSENLLFNKHSFVLHAEMNAIVNRNNNSVKNCRIYVTLFPCINCAKMITQSGIKEVIYLYSKRNKIPETTLSKCLFDKAGVTYRQFRPTKPSLLIDFGTPQQSPLSKL